MADDGTQPDATVRAEALLDDLFDRARAAGVAIAGRVREEAEDLWAEAQALKRSGGDG